MAERIASLEDYSRVRERFQWQRQATFNFGFDVVDQQANSRPSAAAMLWQGEQSERRITFAELASRSNQVAHALGREGLQPGDRILVVLPKLVEWWETLIGIFKAGMVASPGTTLLTPEDLAYRVRASGAVAVVTDPVGAERLEPVVADLPALRSKILVDPSNNRHDLLELGWHSYDALVGSQPTAPEHRATAADEPALLYFTSGTTGPPKMVVHTHQSYGQGHETTGRFWLDLRPDDLHWNISDTGWAKAAWSSLFGPWLCGACVYVTHAAGKFRPAEVLEHLTDRPITTMCAAPTIYRMLVQLDLSGFRPAALRDCVAAGEPLNPEVIATWKSATGVTIRDGYGQTETVLLCGNFPGVPIRPGSMGLPAPGIDLAIVDQDGTPLPAGEEGDLAVRIAPERPVGLFTGYFENPQATAAATRGDWYVTGDRGRTDDEGYFWFIGRADDVITSSAYRIGPFEVESALVAHPAVVEAAVVGRPDPLRNEIVVAFVVLAEGFEGNQQLTAELQEHVKQTTAPYKYPRQIAFLKELPKTISGKIRRVELRARLESLD